MALDEQDFEVLVRLARAVERLAWATEVRVRVACGTDDREYHSKCATCGSTLVRKAGKFCPACRDELPEAKEGGE